MFKRKIKKLKPQLSFYDCSGTLLFTGELDQIPIKETVIIRKSIEFFNDHEPCYIHRGAVTVRLLGEIESYLEMKSEASLIIDKQEESVVDYIDVDGIYRIERLLLL